MTADKSSKESPTDPHPEKPAPATTPSLVKEQPADHDLGEPGDNEEARLDEALKETLPTSDPISIHIE